MAYKAYNWLIKILGHLSILFILFGLYKYLDYRSDLRHVYRNCIYLKKDMSVDQIYDILGTDILPKKEIEMQYDSTYYHYLTYPQLYEQVILGIRVNSQNKISDDFPASCPCYNKKTNKIILPKGLPL